MGAAHPPQIGQGMKEVLIASNNEHKFQEISAILAKLPIKLFRPSDLGLQLDPLEIGTTYYENALLKAQAFHDASGMPVLADDSGLEVELLGGEPGLHSHRYSPNPGASDHDRCLYLLSKLSGRPKPWLAAFHCHAVLYVHATLTGNNHGKVNGEIIEEFRGTNGFGYDPIFWIPKEGKTMAELDTERKNQISHRTRAFTNFELLNSWVYSEN